MGKIKGAVRQLQCAHYATCIGDATYRRRRSRGRNRMSQRWGVHRNTRGDDCEGKDYLPFCDFSPLMALMSSLELRLFKAAETQRRSTKGGANGENEDMK